MRSDFLTRRLPVANRRIVINTDRPQVHAQDLKGEQIYTWFECLPVIIGICNGDLFAGTVDDGSSLNQNGIYTAKTIARARFADAQSSEDEAGSFIIMDARPDRADSICIGARATWIEICRRAAAAAACPERRDAIESFIADERRRFARADTILRRKDVSGNSDYDVEQFLDMKSGLTLSKRLFTFFDPDMNNSWCVQNAAQFCGDVYTIHAPHDIIGVISHDRLGWRKSSSAEPSIIFVDDFQAALTSVLSEIRQEMLARSSGHEAIALIPPFDRTARRIGTVDAFSALFIPRL